jgi:hypothetical protein
MESLFEASQTGLVLNKLVTLTGWAFVVASASVFVVVAAIVRCTFSLVERIASGASVGHQAVRRGN